jgi:RimJ/RimL family protein N-acetyltransferase
VNMSLYQSEIQLSFYRSMYKKELLAFELLPEQKRFTALPNYWIQNKSKEGQWYPIVILQGSSPVGFFVLDEGEDVKTYTSRPNSMLLRSFSVHLPHQGKGYAKKALHLLVSFVDTHFPHIEEIVLGVNENNHAALRLYQSCGFIDQGNRVFGRQGWQYVLHFSLKNEQ